tara:strand:+ start:196 stop:420 length:225 start_codon:yes stop_codon:yes gene_type:complete
METFIMNTLTKQYIEAMKHIDMDQTAIALSHEQNPAQLMLDFDNFYYSMYNNTQTEPLRQAIAINQLIDKYLSI